MQHDAQPTSGEQVSAGGVNDGGKIYLSMYISQELDFVGGVLLYNLGFKLLQTNVKIANNFKSFMLMGRCLSFIIARCCTVCKEIQASAENKICNTNR